MQAESGASKPNGDKIIIAVASIEAATKLFWPIVACIALYVFQQPISIIMGAVSSQISGGGASIEIGTLKIALQKSSILPAPERVKNILVKLRPKDIEFIMTNVGYNNTANVCHGDLSGFQKDSQYNVLKDLNLITFEEKDYDHNLKCVAKSETKFNPLYNETREYLMSVITSTTYK